MTRWYCAFGGHCVGRCGGFAACHFNQVARKRRGSGDEQACGAEFEDGVGVAFALQGAFQVVHHFAVGVSFGETVFAEDVEDAVVVAWNIVLPVFVQAVS